MIQLIRNGLEVVAFAFFCSETSVTVSVSCNVFAVSVSVASSPEQSLSHLT